MNWSKTILGVALVTIGILAPIAHVVRASDDFYQPKNPPEWSHGCDLTKVDQFGEKKRQYCWISVNNLRNIGKLISGAYIIENQTIIKVDKNGQRLARPLGTENCDGRPRRIAVDGARVDSLSDLKIIEKMRTGGVLTWEKQAYWPGCGIAPYATYLSGFSAAYDRMIAEWSSREK